MLVIRLIAMQRLNYKYFLRNLIANNVKTPFQACETVYDNVFVEIMLSHVNPFFIIYLNQGWEM